MTFYDKSIADGYTQKEVGKFLGVSHVAISKMMRIYKEKVKLLLYVSCTFWLF